MKEKIRNGGRWTESRYTSFIRSALRGAFRRWGVKSDVLKAAFTRTKTNKASGRKAKHYRCAICKGEFPAKGMQVDHKEPIGSFKTWDHFIEALYCEKENLQALCKVCHAEKTKKEKQKK